MILFLFIESKYHFNKSRYICGTPRHILHVINNIPRGMRRLINPIMIESIRLNPFTKNPREKKIMKK